MKTDAQDCVESHFVKNITQRLWKRHLKIFMEFILGNEK